MRLALTMTMTLMMMTAIAGCGGDRATAGGADGSAGVPGGDDNADLAGATGAGDAAMPGSSSDGGTPMTPLPDCPCFSGDGIYCGSAVASYGAAHQCSVPGLAQHGGDLLQCTAGAWTVATSCGGAGCYVAPAGSPDGCHVAGATKNVWVVFHPSAKTRDLPGLFQCLLARTDFNDRARGYPNGYGLRWGGSTTAACAGSDYACGVAALTAAKFTVGDHDLIELIEPGYCGGDNNAKADGVLVGNLRVRGANIGDCSGGASEERVAVHEAFESAGHWANADCCTGEVSAATCADNGEAFCPDCPCSCGKFQSDGSYGGYTLDCGGGKTYFSQRVPKNAAGEYDPNSCSPFTLTQ